MSVYKPKSFECLEPYSEDAWQNPSDLPNLEELGIDLATHRNVPQRGVIDFSPDIGVESVASPGFVACSGVIVRDNQSGMHTFGHMQPGVKSFERHMGDRWLADGEAVVWLGERSVPPDALWDLKSGRWGNIETKVISFESGGTWWAGVYNAITSRVAIARRQPVPSILHYQVFSSKDAEK